MFRVSLILEALRARPVLMFWVAALAQGTLWTLVPSLFYAAPPGDVPLVLAVGKEWLLGSPYGPPLAFWARRCSRSASPAGASSASICCRSSAWSSTYWAVFALGRRIVGAAHATMAILLMAGISVFTVPTLEFGPAVLAMPLTALDAAVLPIARSADNRRWRLGRVRCGARAAAAHDLCGADPARAPRAVHPGDRARSQPAALRSGRSRSLLDRRAGQRAASALARTAPASICCRRSRRCRA